MSKKSHQDQTASIRQAVGPKAGPQSGKAARAAGKHSKTHITKISAGRPSESATETKVNTKADTEAYTKVDTKAGTNASTNADTKAGTNADTKVDTNAYTKADTKVSTKAGTKANSDLAEKPIKNTFILFRPFVRLGRYLRDSWRELRQVRWPNRKATWKMTFAVIIYCALFMAAILLLDTLFTFIFNLVITK